jgi:hypothetical protein
LPGMGGPGGVGGPGGLGAGSIYGPGINGAPGASARAHNDGLPGHTGDSGQIWINGVRKV